MSEKKLMPAHELFPAMLEENFVSQVATEFSQHLGFDDNYVPIIQVLQAVSMTLYADCKIPPHAPDVRKKLVKAIQTSWYQSTKNAAGYMLRSMDDSNKVRCAAHAVLASALQKQVAEKYGVTAKGFFESLTPSLFATTDAVVLGALTLIAHCEFPENGRSTVVQASIRCVQEYPHNSYIEAAVAAALAAQDAIEEVRTATENSTDEHDILTSLLYVLEAEAATRAAESNRLSRA